MGSREGNRFVRHEIDVLDSKALDCRLRLVFQQCVLTIALVAMVFVLIAFEKGLWSYLTVIVGYVLLSRSFRVDFLKRMDSIDKSIRKYRRYLRAD